MTFKEIVKNVYSLGVNDFGRGTFDELFELSEGTSYNSFLIRGGFKNALIDLVDSLKFDDFLKNLLSLGLKNIDYVVALNISEEYIDSLSALLRNFPLIKIVTNDYFKKILQEELLLSDDVFILVTDGDTLSLGDKTLQFISTPLSSSLNYISTYLSEEKILFSGNMFSSHRATDQLFVQDNLSITQFLKSFFVQRIIAHTDFALKNLNKIRSLNPIIIAPLFGPLFLDSKYPLKKYSLWLSKKIKKDIVVVYVSLNKHSKKIADYLVDKFLDNGISVKQFNLSETSLDEFLRSLVSSSSLIVCSPSFNDGFHPRVEFFLNVANKLSPKTKLLALINSGFDFKKNSFDNINSVFSSLTNNFNSSKTFDPLLIQEIPSKNDYIALDKYISEILVEHKLLANFFIKQEIKQFVGTIKFIHQETPDVKTFVVTKPSEFSYQSGQYIMFGFADKRKINKKINIPLSIASSPNEEYIRVTIKKNTGYTTAVLTQLNVGDNVLISGPFGDMFTLANMPSRNLVVLSGGSGIVPFMSLMRFVTENNLPYNFTVLYGNKTFQDIIYREEFDHLNAVHKNIFVMNTLEVTDDIWQGEKGFINEVMIRKYVDLTKDNSFLLCGAPKMQYCLATVLSRMGIPENRILKENWGVLRVEDRPKNC